jgi:hypothetical protein
VAIFLGAEKRLRFRTKLPWLARVRSSVPVESDCDEVIATSNSCREGCYFATAARRFFPHSRLFVTFPYSAEPGALNRDYLAEIVRVDSLPGGRTGIAVHFLSPISLALQK